MVRLGDRRTRSGDRSGRTAASIAALSRRFRPALSTGANAVRALNQGRRPNRHRCSATPSRPRATWTTHWPFACQARQRSTSACRASDQGLGERFAVVVAVDCPEGPKWAAKRPSPGGEVQSAFPVPACPWQGGRARSPGRPPLERSWGPGGPRRTRSRRIRADASELRRAPGDRAVQRTTSVGSPPAIGRRRRVPLCRCRFDRADGRDRPERPGRTACRWSLAMVREPSARVAIHMAATGRKGSQPGRNCVPAPPVLRSAAKTVTCPPGRRCAVDPGDVRAGSRTRGVRGGPGRSGPTQRRRRATDHLGRCVAGDVYARGDGMWRPHWRARDLARPERPAERASRICKPATGTGSKAVACRFWPSPFADGVAFCSIVDSGLGCPTGVARRRGHASWIS